MANALVEKGFAVTIIVMELKDAVLVEQLNPTVRLVNLQINHARNSILGIKQFLQQESVSQVLVYTFQLAVVLVLIKKLWIKYLRIVARSINSLDRKITHEKNLWHKWVGKVLIKRWFFDVDHIIAQSTGMKAELEALRGKKKVPVTVIFNFLDKLPKPSVSNQDKSAFNLLFVGKLKEQKNVFFLIDAFKIAKEHEPKLTLSLVGDGDQRKALEDYVSTMNLSEAVSFVGKTSSVGPFYEASSMVLLSSHYEGFPNVLIEANAYGLPVVSLDCPSGPSDIIVDKVNGLLVTEKSRDAFAKAIVEATKIGWDTQSILSTVDRFSKESAVESYLNVLQANPAAHD